MEKDKTIYKATTLKVREDLLQKAKAMAAMKGLFLGEYISSLIEEGLRREKEIEL